MFIKVSCRSRRVRAFTLIEILVALAVLILLATAINQIVISGFDIYMRSSNTAIATMLAQNLIDRIELGDVRISQYTSGVFDEPFQNFSYDVEVYRPDFEIELPVRKIVVVVSWKEGKNIKKLRVETYLGSIKLFD